MEYNAHATCYTWKQLKDENFVKIDMQKTLDQIGMPDESGLFESMGIDEDQYMPIVHVYFNDDLTYN
jgi:hypothetical protein|tara:strand:+ start:783 stop:983 length:201 start_codon:yes stop_codon:yes gene_type:complete